jgi:hypothetical protein
MPCTAARKGRAGALIPVKQAARARSLPFSGFAGFNLGDKETTSYFQPSLNYRLAFYNPHISRFHPAS